MNRWLLRATLAAGLVTGVVVAAPARGQALASVERLSAVSCVSASCLAVGGHTVVATTDGGAHWTAVASPPGVFDLDAVACPAMARCIAVGSGNGDAGAAYGTVDGGHTWRTLPVVVPGGFFLAISCASRAACVATGNGGAVATTVDGGQTWDAQNLRAASLINGVDCVSPTRCEAVAYSGRGAALGVSLRTKDGGRQWGAQPMPSRIPFPTGLSCLSFDRCLATGQDTVNFGSVSLGRIVLTTDGGRSWHQQTVPSSYTYLSGIACPTATACTAVGDGPRAILVTIDGGRTWTPRGPTGTDLRGVTCASASMCVAVGQDRDGHGAIYQSVDGGTTWQRRPVG